MKKQDGQLTGHVIDGIEPGSIAEELEIEPGDTLVSVNGSPITDVFDYQYLTNEEYLEILIRKADGEEWELEIEKEFEEDLGLIFENGLMDEYRSCRNKCVFCFIDQMPPGMRETLYFKDDDSRLSFLQGNYVTLTNMSDKDIDRIVRYHLAPINISFQTTNPELRCKMLHNRFAGEALFLAHGGSAAAAARGAPFGGRRILPGAGGNAGFLCARRRAHHEGKALAPVYPGRPGNHGVGRALPGGAGASGSAVAGAGNDVIRR